MRILCRLVEIRGTYFVFRSAHMIHHQYITREKYLMALFHMFEYIKNRPISRIVFDQKNPVFSGKRFVGAYWAKLYHGPVDPIIPNVP